jgi:hypothetical protein
MASTYLTRTNASATNNTKYTYSAWIKRASLGTNQALLYNWYDGSNHGYIHFSTGDEISIYDQLSGTDNINIKTVRKFRDVSAWYHIVVAVDTTEATQTDRVKIYINGTVDTNLSRYSQPSSSVSLGMKTNSLTNYFSIGMFVNNSSNHFNGCMSHVHYCDGYAYQASDFGETDANGVWKIKTSPSVTYGTNGFFILKDGNSVTDQSGNGNNWSVGGGTLTNTEDSPSNVFCTLNPLISIGNDAGNQQVLSNGNLHVTGNQPSWCHSRGTFGASSGKWYWEVKVNGSTMGYLNIGVSNAGTNMYGGTVQSLSGNTSIYGDGQYNINGTITGAQSPTFSAGDICGVALNMDSNTVSFYKNGTILSWGTNLSISGGTDDVWLPASAVYNTSQSLDFNFGNGYFGTTAVSSAGTNASGIGIFEYDVPTGYTALSTKGLNL